MSVKAKLEYDAPELMILQENVEELICTSPSATTEDFNELTEIEW